MRNLGREKHGSCCCLRTMRDGRDMGLQEAGKDRLSCPHLNTVLEALVGRSEDKQTRAPMPFTPQFPLRLCFIQNPVEMLFFDPLKEHHLFPSLSW